MKLHSGIMEVAVANLLNPRVYTIVPNVSHGLYLNHECDMLALKDGRFTEIEIKISMSDLKADFKKLHGHKSKYITRLVYAMPTEMIEKGLPLIPKNCGVIEVKKEDLKYGLKGFYYKAVWVRQCRHTSLNTELPKDIIEKFYQLGCMRIWSLKSHNYRNKK